ncbi:hypothetical protein [Amycolatopsis sp. FDAARGOS 1241]|uniref:hypothetical protein n=1 Tax=Amycolatopsis sp. FDAARGOS 1241 TaxID=2778070 RepID=UPI00194F45B3|nr:hypothetical protein [Amycolatopsis sp. FDAARGOS 1241]QRP48231.1 hypothetical protein I6J71_10325 [Amycolatopsis sp. FDAARGOS 1241]
MHGGFVRDHFGLAPDRRVLFGVSFGRPDLAHPANGFRTSREDVGNVVRWVTY